VNAEPLRARLPGIADVLVCVLNHRRFQEQTPRRSSSMITLRTSAIPAAHGAFAGRERWFDAWM
jgi:hypothetical protein